MQKANNLEVLVIFDPLDAFVFELRWEIEHPGNH